MARLNIVLIFGIFIHPSSAACPTLLKPLCELVNGTECFARCIPEIKKCINDTACRPSLISTQECIVGQMLHKNPNNSLLTCLVPDNAMRDDVFYCLMDKNTCIPSPPGPVYPACRESSIPGALKLPPLAGRGPFPSRHHRRLQAACRSTPRRSLGSGGKSPDGRPASHMSAGLVGALSSGKLPPQTRTSSPRRGSRHGLQPASH